MEVNCESAAYAAAGFWASEAGRVKPSVPQAADDLLSVIHAAEENREDPDFGQRIIDLEIENKIFVGHGADARPNFRVLRAPVGLGDECPHIRERAVNPGRRARDGRFKILAKFLVGFDEMFLDKIKIA